MSHGKIMETLAKEKEPVTKNWVKVLKADMKLDGKEAKLKAKKSDCQRKAMDKKMK